MQLKYHGKWLRIYIEKHKTDLVIVCSVKQNMTSSINNKLQ